MYYTGVGSRETPLNIQGDMCCYSSFLCERGYTLRSGGAPGADLAFQSGCCGTIGNEIWIPWKSFAPCLIGNYITINDEQFNAAREFLISSGILPWFDKMKRGAQLLHARNYYQIVGVNGEYSEFCVYYAKTDRKGAEIGGTRTAVFTARHFGIPTYNLKSVFETTAFESLLEEL